MTCRAMAGWRSTEKGHALLRGEARSKAVPSSRATGPKRQARAEQHRGAVGRRSDVLIASLKALRLRLSRERRVPPYVIFSDRSLIDMAQRRPKNECEFGEVHGVGAAKLKDFARDLPARHRRTRGVMSRDAVSSRHAASDSLVHFVAQFSVGPRVARTSRE